MRLVANVLDSKGLEDKPEKFKVHFRKVSIVVKIKRFSH